MDTTVQQEKSAQDQWNRHMQLLAQLSRRLLEHSYGDTYLSAVSQVQHVLTEMQRIAQDFPGREPYGSGYRDAHDGLRSVLVQLEADLKALTAAKQAAMVAAADISWGRVLEESQRRR